METNSSNKPLTDQPKSLTYSGYSASITIGYILLAISCIIYSLTEYFGEHKNLFMIFWVHYILAAVYTAFLISDKSIGIRKSWRKEYIDKTVILINLFLVSAYALNRELAVFENSDDWLCIYIILSSFTILTYKFFGSLPTWINNLQYFFTGCAIVLYIYLSIYTFNYYPFGAIGIIAFGIGGHILVPVFLVLACTFLFIHHSNGIKSYVWAGSGISVMMIIIIAFVIEWNSRISKIETLANQSVMYGEAELPVWVTLGQQVENDWISERILKSDIVYTTASENFGEWRFMPRMVSWDEVQKHDPLVYISSLFSRCSLSDEDRVKILKAISNGRHRANERLWSGDNLTTSYIVSDVDIFTDLRIAYTEQYLNVKNNSARGSWNGNREEGIYTFYLPEGSVVTSLSLWVNGNERKGILTSKQKATKAYNTIVGVEQRDPSVIHWQEGNTVTVRVFPCTTAEERKFKIGVTSPLQEENGKIVYNNIVFDGPSTEAARETRRIRFIGSLKNIPLSSDFKRDKNGDYIREQKYSSDFQIAFEKKPLTSNHFTFDGFTYSIAAHAPQAKPASIKTIFLDINNTWTNSEVNDLQPLLENYKVSVYSDDKPVELDKDNWNDITAEMKNQNYSLFPFHHLKDLPHVLVVTKGNVLSPHLSDFKESKFAENVNAFFSTGNKVKLFSLEGNASTYINSFKELRGLEFAKGNVSDLQKWLDTKTFPQSSESEEQIIIQDADLIISKIKSDSTAAANNAPDHLARLFAYNNIMRKAGAHYFSHDFINEDLVDEASTAYVVSPVSSLIVLETQEDYERFDIQDKENSLHNAAKQSSGAVPEPHEWALIILFAIFILYLRFKS